MGQFWDFKTLYDPVTTEWDGISHARAFNIKLCGEGDNQYAGFLYKEFVTDDQWLGWQHENDGDNAAPRPIKIFKDGATWPDPPILLPTEIDVSISVIL